MKGAREVEWAALLLESKVNHSVALNDMCSCFWVCVCVYLYISL